MYSILCESYILRTIYRIWQAVINTLKSSFFMQLALVVFRRIKSFLSASIFVQLFLREGYVSKRWENSCIFSVFKWLLLLPVKILNPLYLKLDKYLQGSLTLKIIVTVVNNIHFLAAAMLFVFLVAPFDLWDNRYALIMLASLTLILFIRPLVKKGEGVNARCINFYMAVFAFAVCAAQIFSTSPGKSLRFFVFYVNCFLIVFLIASSIKSVRKLQQFLEIVLIGVTITGLYGIWQAIVGVPVDPSLTDISANPDMPGRIYSTIGNTNDYAELLVMLLPFYFVVFMYSRSIIKKLMFSTMAVPPFIALLLTYSRTSWIGFTVAVFICVLFINKKMIIPVIIFGLFLIPLLPQTILTRIQTIFTGDKSIDFRFKIYQTVAPVFQKYWISGIGLGTDVFRDVVGQYPLYTGAIPPHSHNLVLQVWIESGIIGAVSFVGLLLNFFKQGVAKIRQKIDATSKYTIIICISALSGVITTGMGEYIWHTHRVMLAFWAVVGILIAAVTMKRSEDFVEKK